MMIRRLAMVGLVAALWGDTLPAEAQLSTNLESWMRRIHSGEYGAGRGGRGGRWIENGRAYTTIERGNLVRYDTATGERSVLMTAEQLTPPGFERPLTPVDSDSHARRLLFSTNPRPTMIRKTAYDYWVLDTLDDTWRKLGGKNATNGLLYATLSPDNTRAAYIRDNNIYVEDLRTGRIRQLTSDGSPMIINGTSDWVNEEEFYLREAFAWSPDSRHIAYLQFDQSGVPEFALINYTDSLYPEITKYPYPKVGQTNSAVRAGIVSASGGRTRWARIPGNPRDIYIPRIGWADADHVILQQMDRPQHTNNIWLVEARTGRARLMYQDRDETWVDLNRNFIWVGTSGGSGKWEQRLIYHSERDGWRHAYAISRDGDALLITTGNFDMVSIAGIDEAGGWLYYIASPENATQRYLYRSRLDGTGAPERITPRDMPGTHSYDISPDGRWAFHSWSRFDRPPVSDLVSLPDHKVVRVFEDNAQLREKVAAVLRGRAELLQVDVGDGVTLDGWLIRPTDFDPDQKYPLIVYVYGEPASTTVNDSWGGTGRLFLAALADEGYLIASFDNRGTPAPRGRAWRKAIYGAVGVISSKEQAAAVRALAKERPYVDLDRVGVYGWSGGGSMTLNLMFRFPELYKVGVAGAPVPDQLLYDSIYQERYSGMLEEHADGYKAGSPITHAEGLQGKLLIIHGTGDDNVHFQGTQRLINRLIALNKQFYFMEYPNRRHGISGTHIDTLRYGFFLQHLPPGGRER
ncbi:MAG TPA: S9 family peptidase [Verrucomicrobia bacterium]|nr:S9 family peptidase [Verrucomicrobiota bacterium]HOB32325.1 S9 family peptidase [Verrucomicrobiota bacterium]HOP98111.1 S9 family peptidase [Verrucomicrobiota bacterium]